MRYMIMMGTIDDLHHVGEGDSLSDALLNLVCEVLDEGDEEEIADVLKGLRLLDVSGLIVAVNDASKPAQGRETSRPLGGTKTSEGGDPWIP